MSEELNLSKTGRQYPLNGLVRIKGADLQAGTVRVPIPANTLLLSGRIHVITGDGGTAPTVNVGIDNSAETDPDEHLANGAIVTAGSSVALNLALSALYTVATDLTVAYGTGTPNHASDLLFQFEYLQLERSNEVFG